ncbi:hypothetical protein [Lentzea sp. E54]|uniref:hypothetical protein n=1 Tax=Lentzea xerophila TaxID=3435883 RepID=UPI003DA238E3
MQLLRVSAAPFKFVEVRMGTFNAGFCSLLLPERAPSPATPPPWVAQLRKPSRYDRVAAQGEEFKRQHRGQGDKTGGADENDDMADNDSAAIEAALDHGAGRVQETLLEAVPTVGELGEDFKQRSEDRYDQIKSQGNEYKDQLVNQAYKYRSEQRIYLEEKAKEAWRKLTDRGGGGGGNDPDSGDPDGVGSEGGTPEDGEKD